MQAIRVLTVADHDCALSAGRSAGIKSKLDASQLNAPQSDAVDDWFRQIWDQIEDAIGEATRGAIDKASAIKAETLELWDQAQAKLGKRATQLRNKILIAVDTYLQELIDRALQRVGPSLIFGDASLKVKSVKVDQSIKISLSLKSALDEIISFACDGTLTISIEYAAS